MKRRFANLDPAHRPHSFAELLRWSVLDRLSGRRIVNAPGPAAPSVEPDLKQVHAVDGAPRLTWIGHASFLGSLSGCTFLIDPVFSRRAAVVPRHVAPGLAVGDLPELDVLLVTHSHYDHLDAASVSELPRNTPVVVPLGLGRWFRRRGFDHLTELDWWESTSIGGLSVTLVPARHWSRRGLTDTNRTLWGGFVIAFDDYRVYHAGDSGWFGGFSEIGRRFPDLLAAMLPVGSYAPAWFMEPHHMNPEQALDAFDALGARNLIPMHWGTFQLTDEPLLEPRQRLTAAWDSRPVDDGRRLRVMSIGQTEIFDG